MKKMKQIFTDLEFPDVAENIFAVRRYGAVIRVQCRSAEKVDMVMNNKKRFGVKHWTNYGSNPEASQIVKAMTMQATKILRINRHARQQGYMYVEPWAKQDEHVGEQRSRTPPPGAASKW